jgi:dihydropyrimidine dehydrogenase (NAD+) subunit PreA
VVCPVENCITLRELKTDEMDVRTGKRVSAEYQNWSQHPNNTVA